MSTPLENYVEQIFVLALQAQTDLSGVTVVAETADAAPGAAGNRITVKASPRQPVLPGLNPSTTRMSRIPVAVRVHLQTRDAATYQTWVASIEAAFADGATLPAGALAIVTASLPSACLYIDPTDEGDVEHSENIRQRGKTFNAIIAA
jgi:hypothetical protein